MQNDISGLSGMIERSRLSKKLCLIAFITALLLCGIVFTADVIFEWSGLKIFSLAIFPLTFALIFSVAALVQTTFFSRMLLEEEEKQLLGRRRESVGNILDVSEDVRFSASRTLKNFEKYIPAVVAVSGFLIGAAILYFLNRAPVEAEAEATAELLQVNVPANPINLAFLSVVSAVFAFFGGVFLSGQAGLREFRYLKAIGNMLVFSGVVLFLAAASALFYIYGKTNVETYLTNIVFYAECVLTVELLANFIMDFYRPRNQEEQRPVYESRLLAIFTEPGGVMRNLAASLDYQFGFKVSKTSVYKFIEKVFIPALLIWAFLLWAFTAVSEVGPGELGIRERFGKAVGNDLEPGVHFKLPWPFERIIRVPVDGIQCVTVGLPKEDKDKKEENKDGKQSKNEVVLWNQDHKLTEDPFLVAIKTTTSSNTNTESGTGTADSISHKVAILETKLPIYYRAKRSEIRNYAYNFDNIPDTLLAIGKAEATAYLASADFDYIISEGRENVCNILKERIQKQCDTMNMGIEIVRVNMMDAHPPIGKAGDPKSNVAESYQQVVIAGEEAKQLESKARSEAAKITNEGNTKKQRITSEAEIYKTRVVELAKAEEKLYQAQLKAFQTAPEMFKLRHYLDFIVNDCKDKRKFIISKSLLSRIYEFNFEEKAKLNLLEDQGETAPEKE